MAFFDEISSFTKGVGAQVKGNYDVVALNTKISGVQKEINALYEALGAKYYEEKQDSPDEALESIVAQIKQKYEEIASMQKEIETTKTNMVLSSAPKGARVCPNCGAAVDAGNLFCVKCGTRQPEESVIEENEENTQVEEPEFIFCPECGTKLTGDSTFCTECGARI